MAELRFIRQNTDWNAEPNAPEPRASMDGPDLLVSFRMSSSPFGIARLGGALARLNFRSCSRWCWDSTNDEGWHAGAGRFARQAPRWGEFYEVLGGERLGENDIPGRTASALPTRHFIFYFRDEVIESYAEGWELSCEGVKRSGPVLPTIAPI